MADIEIRPLRALSDMRAMVELQRAYWGDETESVIPAHMLFSLANHGGHVLAAFEGDTPAGVLIGYLGTHMEDTRRPAMANLQIVSKRMVVLPEYRGQHIGYRLKLAQRDMALTQGVRLVVWTFDPLLAVNAHLNIRKLGAICPQYHEDYYGTDQDGGLTTLGSSDRLQVEWWVTGRRVEERLFGRRGDLTLSQYREADTTILNPTTMTADGLLLPAEQTTMPSTSLALLEIPLDYGAMVEKNPKLARTWRMHTRLLFKQVFAQGFIVTDFIREQFEGRDRTFYLLSYNGPQFETFRMN
jgi:predicted GNAT superfamily acetyltransferase